jgi:hypothetical protein
MDDRKLAEFIGIMLGDGYFVGDRLKISFNSQDDLEYLNYVKNLANKLFDINPIIKFRKNENCVDLFIFKRNILRLLVDKGLVKSPKWNRAIIPNSFLEYDVDVLRGYFDTDGCVVVTNNNGTSYLRLEMKVCPSPMQEQFVNILNKYDFCFGVYQIGKGKVRVQLNGKKQVKKWLDLIGFSNPKHLRKIKNVAREGFEPSTFTQAFIL